MKISRFLLCATALIGCIPGVLAETRQTAPATEQPAAAACDPVGKLSFLCGLGNAEDLLIVPGTDWIVAGGIGTRRGIEATPGLRLIDAKTGQWQHWVPTKEWAAKHDAASFPACDTPPDRAKFMAHGIALAKHATGAMRLYAVNHAERERIEVFEVDFTAKQPAARWVGCVKPPAPINTNSVAVAPDGTIYATVFIQPGKTIDDVLAGRPTGEIIYWKPGAASSQSLPGTALSGNNGLEISRDGTTLYVVAFGGKALHAYDRTGKEVGRASLGANYWPDNVRWDDQGRLIVAGMTTNDAKCLDPASVAAAQPRSSPCYKAYVVEAVDPKTLTVEVLASEPTTTAFSHVSGATVHSDKLWIGTVGAQRLAYRKLTD